MRHCSGRTARIALSALLWGVLLVLVGTVPATASGAPVTTAVVETRTGQGVPAPVRSEPLDDPVTTALLVAVGEHGGRPVLLPPAPGGPVALVHEPPVLSGAVLAVRRERGPPPPPSDPRSTRAPPPPGAVDV
ncbi:hypothetical protein ACSMX9_29645 [Streptomyces sp. LE64]|uniref:hypothetical protein n=1 Tax=Streptomyces sp. LE64 TaxID=3448653 RepID=UPI0040429406